MPTIIKKTQLNLPYVGEGKCRIEWRRKWWKREGGGGLGGVCDMPSAAGNWGNYVGRG